MRMRDSPRLGVVHPLQLPRSFPLYSPCALSPKVGATCASSASPLFSHGMSLVLMPHRAALAARRLVTGRVAPAIGRKSLLSWRHRGVRPPRRLPAVSRCRLCIITSCAHWVKRAWLGGHLAACLSASPFCVKNAGPTAVRCSCRVLLQGTSRFGPRSTRLCEFSGLLMLLLLAGLAPHAHGGCTLAGEATGVDSPVVCNALVAACTAWGSNLSAWGSAIASNADVCSWGPTIVCDSGVVTQLCVIFYETRGLLKR